MSEPSAWPERFDYRVDILPRRNRVRVTHGDRVLAESDRCLLIDEQDHGLVFYVPRADVHMDELEPIELLTRCPFKGSARHWALRGGDGHRIAWSYEDPYPEVARIKDYVAFYQNDVTLTVGAAPYGGRR